MTSWPHSLPSPYPLAPHGTPFYLSHSLTLACLPLKLTSRTLFNLAPYSNEAKVPYARVSGARARRVALQLLPAMLPSTTSEVDRLPGAVTQAHFSSLQSSALAPAACAVRGGSSGDMSGAARRRLGVVVSHTATSCSGGADRRRSIRPPVVGDSEQRATASAPAAGGTHVAAATPTAASSPLRLLSDSEMIQFVSEGYITLPVAEHDPAFHDAIHARAEQLFTSRLNYGNTRNIYPVIPELESIMHGPTVAGALTSVLGADYVMDRRKHMHNSSSQGDQRFHKDCQRGKSLTGHMPRCCMIFYLPAGCTEGMGPSEILPGSHCLRTLLPAELDTDAEVAAWNPTSTAAAHLSPLKVVTPLRQGTITMVHCKMHCHACHR